MREPYQYFAVRRDMWMWRALNCHTGFFDPDALPPFPFNRICLN